MYLRLRDHNLKPSEISPMNLVYCHPNSSVSTHPSNITCDVGMIHRGPFVEPLTASPHPGSCTPSHVHSLGNVFIVTNALVAFSRSSNPSPRCLPFRFKVQPFDSGRGVPDGKCLAGCAPWTSRTWKVGNGEEAERATHLLISPSRKRLRCPSPPVAVFA